MPETPGEKCCFLLLCAFQEIFSNAQPGGFKVFRQHTRLADNGHEVGVAGPARQNVQMEVACDSGTCRLAQIQAHVDAIGAVGATEDSFQALRCVHQFVCNCCGQSSKRSFMRVGQCHKVP